MPKMKTNSAAKKRFRVTGSGKLVHKRSGRSAKMEKKSSRVTRRLADRGSVAGADVQKARKLLAL